MSKDQSKTAKKIKLIRQMIDHERTSDELRDTARRMLQRLLNKAKAEGADAVAEVEQATAGWYQDNRAYGVKYDHSHRLSTVDIAKLVRADIKLAQKLAKMTAEPGAVKTVDPIGDAPAEIKISVRSEHFSGGSAIDITIKNIPEAWGWEKREVHGHMRQMPTPALKALADELATVMGAYNHDGSDLSTDYWDVRFYASVSSEDGRMLA